MFKQSHIYVIAFDSGTLKAGRAADGAGRLAAHRREAARHGITVTSQWCSPPCNEGAAVHYEQRLLAFCASRGALRAGLEYFHGMEFSEVQSFAETLVGAADPLPVADEIAPTATIKPPSRGRPPVRRFGRIVEEENEELLGEFHPAPPRLALLSLEQREQLLRLTPVDEMYEA